MPEEQPPYASPPPKHDMNVSPAGLPGEPGGQENQCFNILGGVVAGPPQSGEPVSTPPVEIGVDPGTTGPAEQGTPGTEFPAGPIGPENVPAGE